MKQDNLLSKLFLWQNISPSLLIVIVLVIVAGVGTGYFLSRQPGGGIPGGRVEVAPGAVVKDKEIGLNDEKTFRDSAQGTLKEGGIDGEGSYHLERTGGESQNVYLTSSVIDLGEFIGKKVEVWGETQKGQKAGWLMDVGKIKIIE